MSSPIEDWQPRSAGFLHGTTPTDHEDWIMHVVGVTRDEARAALVAANGILPRAMAALQARRAATPLVDPEGGG